MDTPTNLHGSLSGRNVTAAPQASHGGSNNFHFYENGPPGAQVTAPKSRQPSSTVPFPT